MSKPRLDVKNLFLSLWANYKYVPVLQNINFSLYPGETLMIMGESGCGKSMLCRSLMRLEPSGSSISGAIEFQSQNNIVNLIDLNEQQLRKIRGHKISLLFQNAALSLNPVLSCLKQIEDVIQEKDKKLRRRIAIELIRRVGFEEPEKTARLYPHELSGGMAQRICLAIVIGSQPEIIIADEPTASLDAQTAMDTHEILNEYKQEHNASIIYVSHDLRFCKKYADKILVIYGGAVMEFGDAEHIINSPQHPYTKALLECETAIFNGDCHPGIPGEPPLNIDLPTCPFHHRCPNTQNRCIIENPELIQHNHTICACHFVE